MERDAGGDCAVIIFSYRKYPENSAGVGGTNGKSPDQNIETAKH